VPKEKPALLHGDLWSGNVISDEKGAPVWIDPAVYYGHREMDLAMMKLFGGFSEAVFSTYQEHFPLEANWQERIPYHQLYPLLVHLNLFGSSYYPACRQIWLSFA
jgi:fructosamine-3-kinase